MTAAVVDGEPPLPPEHTSPPPIQCDNLCEEEESKHSAASSILPLSHHGTERHVPNNVAIFNGRHLVDHDTTPTAPPPSIAPLDPTTYATALPLAPPPPSIDLDDFAESISEITYPQYPTQRSTNNTTTTTNLPTTTTTTTDEDHDDDDIFEFFDLPATSDSAENTASNLTSRETTPHHKINYYEATTPTNSTTTPTINDDDDDEHFFAFLNLPETFATAANAGTNLTLDRAPPQHHAIHNYYDATTTTTNPTTTPTTDDDNNDDADFFELSTTPETFESAVNASSTLMLDRATPPYHLIDETDDATTKPRMTTTMTPTTEEEEDYNFFAPSIFLETPDSAANDRSPWKPEPMTIPDNQHNKYQPLPIQPTTHWIHDTFAPVFQAVDRLVDAITDLSASITAVIETLAPRKATNLLILTPPPRKATNLLILMPPWTCQQKLDPQQTHHRHKKHTKHRHFLLPSLPSPSPHFTKCLPFLATIRFPSFKTYHRYLASNFR